MPRSGWRAQASVPAVPPWRQLPRPFYLFTFYLFTFKVYLIFSVMMVSAASMMVTIQKRMVIFDSWTTLLGPRHR